MSVSPAAERLLEDGVERVIDVAVGAVRLRGVLHLPRHVRGAVLVCSPTQADFALHHPQEVALARVLAGRGVAAARFAPRGHGDSGGTPDLPVDAMAEDARRVLGLLPEGVPVVAVGSRWGALVAAALAAGFPPDGVVLWHPVADPLLYLAEAARAAAATRLMKGRVADGHPLDAAGYPVDRRAVRASPNLIDAFGTARPPLLLVHDGTRPPGLDAAGFDVDAVEGAAVGSWFADDRSTGVDRPTIDAVAGWIVDRVGAR